MLEQQLVEWPGTLLLVSHDRRFLDNVVTSTLAFEGDGRVEEYVGGYEDYLRQRPAGSTKDVSGGAKGLSGNTKDLSGSARDLSGNTKNLSGRKKKRTFKEEREYKELPDRIAALEEEQTKLQTSLADPELYKQGATVIQQAVDRSDEVQRELHDALTRWDELDSIGN